MDFNQTREQLQAIKDANIRIRESNVPSKKKKILPTGEEFIVLGDKVDVSKFVEKEEGKGLSSNDFTDEDKQIIASSRPVDISGKVDKITGSSLVADTEILKIHANSLDHTHSNKSILDSIKEVSTSGGLTQAQIRRIC